MRQLLAASLLLLAAPALAETDTERARQEALQFLGRCPAEPADLRQLCLADQMSFVWDYVSAKSGNFEDQTNVAFMFAHGGAFTGKPYPQLQGREVRQDDLQACAWHLVMMTSGDPKMHLGLRDVGASICRRTGEDARDVVAARAARIAADIRYSRARPLPGDTSAFYALAEKGRLTDTTFPLGDAPPAQPPRKRR